MGCNGLEGISIGSLTSNRGEGGKTMHTSVRRRGGLTNLPMIDQLRTVVARFIVHDLHRPRPLLVAA